MKKVILKTISLCTLYMTLLSVFNVANAQITNGLLHEFKFDNTYSNTSSTINFSNAAFTTDRAGISNSALSLTGNGSTATIPNLPLGNSARTVSMWFRLGTLNSNYNFLFSYGTGSAPYGAFVVPTFVNAFAPNHQVTSPHVANQWYHYVFSYDGTTSRIYRNGILIGTSTVAVNTVNNSNLFRLGLSETGVTGYFNGAIDDLKIYNRALSANEVYEVYGQTPTTPAVQWLFQSHTNADGGLYPFSTPPNTGMHIDRFGNNFSALYMNNSGSVAAGVAPLPLGNSARTISFWFKRSQSDFQELFVYGSSGSTSCFGLYVTANGAFVNYHTQQTSTYVAMSGSGNEPIAPDTWHHMTVVYTQDSSKIYRNGLPIGLYAYSGTLVTTGTNLLLGKVLTTSSNPFQGTFDEIKIYNGALSPAEIAASYNAALPAKLNHFTAQLKNQTAQLNWSTITEINTSHFEVEYSNNGREFNKVATVTANGNSSSTKNYTAIHSVNNEPIHYYRLKMMDKDGQFTYSQIVKLKTATKGFNVEVYPTVVTNQANVNINATEKTNGTISITNMQGQLIKRSNVNIAVGSQTTTLDVSSLSKGSYLVTIQTNKEQQSFKIIKQ
jgi:hypothetical protein